MPSSETQNNKLSQLNKLFKLIWQKKICCDNKSWKYIFYSVISNIENSCSSY